MSTDKEQPILVYGGGSSTSQFNIQLLHAAGHTNVVITASLKHHEYTRTANYNNPSDMDQLKQIGIRIAVDSIARFSILEAVSKIVSDDATVAVLVPVKRGNQVRTEMAEEVFTSVPEKTLLSFSDGVKVLPVETPTYIMTQDVRILFSGFSSFLC